MKKYIAIEDIDMGIRDTAWVLPKGTIGKGKLESEYLSTIEFFPSEGLYKGRHLAICEESLREI